MGAADVPHFRHGGVSPEDAHAHIKTWLAGRGLAEVQHLIDGSEGDVCAILDYMEKYNAGVYYRLIGEGSAGVGHEAVYCGGRLVCDPSGGRGITGPMPDDGCYRIIVLVPRHQCR